MDRSFVWKSLRPQITGVDMKTLERLKNLVAADRPQSRPLHTFDRAVQTKSDSYSELRDLVAEVLFLQARHQDQIQELRAEVARLHHEAKVATRGGAHGRAQRLVFAKSQAHSNLADAEAELAHLRAQAEQARRQLVDAGTTLASLSQERDAAHRTQRLHSLSQRISAFDGQGELELEQARLQIERIRAEHQLEAELNGQLAWADR